jgi:penicillin-binding protein 1C
MSEQFEQPTRFEAYAQSSSRQGDKTQSPLCNRQFFRSLNRSAQFARLATIVLAFFLTACDAQPTVSARREAQVAATLLQGEAEQRIAAYQAAYQLAPRPAGDLQTVAETYMRRYQPGPEPRVFASSYVYDRKGRLLDEIFDEGRRIWIPLSQISPSLVQAVVATEDASFYTNPGVDTRRVVAAMARNLGNPEQLSGASTLTMQLARALFLPPDVRFAPTLDRKITEVLMAQELTALFSKDEILEMYLNLAYFGHLAYGPEAAARTYFGKSALALSMAEATLLAGLPQQPANLDPFLNFDAARRRQRIVLDLMVRHGALNVATADLIFAEPIRLAPDPDHRAVQAPHFLQYLRTYLARHPDLPPLGRTGANIYTTLDLDLQTLAQQIVSEQVAALRPRFALSNAALVALKPGSAEVLVMVGSADFANDAIDGQVNVVLRQRQPGSALKPMLYAAAFDANLISPATVLWDLSVTYPITGSQPYTPRNYDSKLRGPVTVRMALANSLNVPTVKLMEGLGLPRFVETANRMGIASLDEDDIARAGLAMTLGGSEVTLFELASAYHTIANQGAYVEPTPILRMTDSRGRPLELPAAAYLVTDILSDNDARTPLFGVNNSLQLTQPAAAKTGTTTSFRDNWTVGFTRYLVAGVWAGNNDGSPMRNATGVTGAAPIWNAFMEAVIADPNLRRTLDAPDAGAGWDFVAPEDIVRIRQGCPPELRCPGEGELFTHAWLAAHVLAGPFADAYQVGLFSRVQVEQVNGQNVLAGVCLQQRTPADDPDAQMVLTLPRGFGEQAARWRYVDTLAEFEIPATVEEALPLVNGVFDLSLRPFLPTPGAKRPAVFVYAGRTLEEQRAAFNWMQARAGVLTLGNCAEVEGMVRALYGDRVRRIAISEPPRALAASVVTSAVTLTGTLVVADAEREISTGARTYLLSSVNTDSNCPGNYVMGRVVNAAGIGVGGVAVQMVDQWGNKTVASSKGGAESGAFDLPIYSGSQNDLAVTVLDVSGMAASPTITLQYPPENEAARCYHLVWRVAS